VQALLCKASLEGAIQVITLNRPDKSNALHPDLVSQLAETLNAAASNHA
jgi:enoyl-CoA hydratase/carnithine racemase